MNNKVCIVPDKTSFDPFLLSPNSSTLDYNTLFHTTPEVKKLLVFQLTGANCARWSTHVTRILICVWHI